MDTEAGKDGGGALYLRILDDIRDRILSGEWPPGHRIPFEHELADGYRCSRMTVNKAMSELARAGLIERRRRSGSFVRMPESQAAVLEIQDIRAEVEALGLPYRYERVSRKLREANRKDEADTGFAAGTGIVDLVCRHIAGPAPFCLEQRSISLAAVPEAASESFETVAPSPWLVARIPWSAGEHRIRAMPADDHVAAMLGVARNAACLVVQRRTWSGDLPVTQVVLTYPGETHSLVARFAPKDG
ncbi:histidine utilization repressor [Mesorhizobium sp. ZMM04-5]|uniref:Histidine utilization repressor n=1 Tax=Mesorhizobium marinum TaxID=3228790 RepID=A0ABV3QVY0_9HYPH